MTPLQYMHASNATGSPSHICLLLLLGMSYDTPHIFFYFSVPTFFRRGRSLHFFVLSASFQSLMQIDTKINTVIHTPTNWEKWHLNAD